MAPEAVWPTLLCTRTKVILSLRSSPLVRAWLPAYDPTIPSPLLPSFLARLTFSGAFLVGVIDTDTLLFLAATTSCDCMLTGAILYTYEDNI